jgi:ATP-dependent DNA ligase
MATRRIGTDGFVNPCIPTLAAKSPSGPRWVHEIKHNGYRLIVRRDGKAVRLFARRGHNRTERYPAIASATSEPRLASGAVKSPRLVPLLCDIPQLLMRG